MIRQLLVENGMSHNDLAMKLGVDRTTVVKWLGGRVPIPDRRKVAIAKALGVDSRTIFPDPIEVPVEISQE